MLDKRQAIDSLNIISNISEAVREPFILLTIIITTMQGERR